MTINRIVEALLVSSFVAFTTVGSAIAQPPPPCVTGGAVTTPTAVTTYHYDNLRTGWNCNETILTPASIQGRAAAGGNSGLFLLSTTPLDEQVDAQPLFVPQQKITTGANPGTYDVVYVVTEGNTIYAINASTGKVLLQNNLGTPVSQSNLPNQCTNNSVSVGINSTPVIDLVNKAMYVIVYTQTPNKSNPQTRQDFDYKYYLHELDLGSLTDLAPPLLVSASHQLPDKTTVQFNAGVQRQRPALLFIPVPGSSGVGNLYAGFGSFCDQLESRGWVLGWQTGPRGTQAKPLGGSQLNNINPPSDGQLLSSIWMSGFGIAADTGGNLYFVAGNSNTGVRTFNSVTNPSNSVLKVISSLKNVGTSQTSVLDQFTPSNHNALDAEDSDFGSGGVTLLPDQPGLGTFLTQGKTVTQSSDYGPATGASKAVDGNTDGNFFHGSVTHTNLDANAWWQVDLGTSATISSILIWNRTDCCSDRLSDYWVFVSDKPLPTGTPQNLSKMPGIWFSNQKTYPKPSITIPVNAQGRYVRVQLSGTNYLSLAEVRVFGTSTPLHLSVAAGKDGIMYLNDRDSMTVPLDYAFIGPCFCGQSYFHAWGLGRIVSSGGANVEVWHVVTLTWPPTPSPYLVREISLPVQQNAPDGGFFTSISSNGEGSMIIWAVPRPNPPTCPDPDHNAIPPPPPVWLYAFEAPQSSAGTALKQIFKAQAGTWTNPKCDANANIVPVVANGKVFVASYKQLNIFGLTTIIP
jgi:hypothetical protein